MGSSKVSKNNSASISAAEKTTVTGAAPSGIKDTNEKLARTFAEYVKYGESGKQTTNEVVRAVVECILGPEETAKVLEKVKAEQSSKGGLNVES